MRGYRFVAWVVALLGIMLAVPLLTHAEEQEFLEYVNLQPRFSRHQTWAVFLGTGWTRENLEQIRDWEKQGKWVNPFTGRPFENVKIFAFGQPDPLREGLRIITDHLEIHLLSSWDEVERHHFDFALCHSNGCTNAFDLHRVGKIRVDNFLALGTDWTSKAFGPGDLRGARAYFFMMKGDPIPKIPAPNWARITENTPGLDLSVPFDRPGEIAAGVGKLLTHGRSDPDRFPVIRLDPPPGGKPTTGQPLQAHGIVESYFPSVSKWMRSRGKFQKALSEEIQKAEAAAGRRDDRDDQRKNAQGPPDCPGCGCPGCGDGGGPGGMQGNSGGIGGGTPPGSPAAKSVSLPEAIEQGLVAFELGGTGSPFAARLQVRKLTDESLTLTIQPGMVLQPEGGATQRLVVY